MDAKAKVVWLYEVDAGTECACWFVVNRVDDGAVPFIPLTDHEAAMAEVEERRDHWHDYSVRRVEEITKLTEQLATLLTGLEALAGDAAAYMVAVETMNAAIKDGGNVHGAVSGLIGAQDNLEASLATADTLTNSAKGGE